VLESAISVGLISRVAFGLIFLSSGTLKLRDKKWPMAAGLLRVPRLAIPVVAPLEITVGALLVVGFQSTLFIWVGLGSLIVFSAVLTNALRFPKDERPVCACFGVLAAQPVSAWSLLRNGAFMLLAIVALTF
jgi:uncharacterized membrane protein YphA (DoxX/SURF4 family)